MDIEEAEQTSVCIACGKSIDASTARAFAYGEGDLLCWSCALERGGVFDEDREDWVRPPDLKGLPDIRATGA
jgi:hypothetical protein